MDFVTIDFETAKYSQESACSVGLVKYLNGKVEDTFYSLICPPSLYIRPDFTEIHGLTVDDVRDAPTFINLWDRDIKPFIGSLPLAAHNASFDMEVLTAVLEWYNLDVPELQYFCTLNLARNTWLGLKSYSLTSLAKHFRIFYNAHNALDDAMTCGKLIQMSAEKYAADDVAQLLLKARVKMRMLTKTKNSGTNGCP